MPPFAIRRIDHVVLRVHDLDRSTAYYRDVLGCTVARLRPELGLVHLRAGASLIDLVDVAGVLGRAGGAPPAGGGRDLDHLCLRIDPFDEPALRAHLAAHGVTPRGELAINFGAEGHGPSLYVEDPDGHVIELKGPAVSSAPDPERASTVPAWEVATAVDPAALRRIEEGVRAHGRAQAVGGRAEPLACIARVDGAVVAGASGRTEYGRLFVNWLWVDGGWRGRGLGGAALARIEAAAAGRGCREAMIETLDAATAAWYRRLGYRMLVVVERFVGPFDRHLLLKPLPPPS